MDGLNVVNCNNLHPTITILGITYPVGQEALKDNETATVQNTITDFDDVEYISPNLQLNITDSLSYNQNKVVNRVSGGYNINSINFRIVATRNTNGAVSTRNRTVYIAHDEQIVTINEQYERLRSSPSGSSYQITLVSNQRLIEQPTLNIPIGTLTNEFTSSDNLTWRKNVTISDTDSKGNHNYSNLITKNLAGRIVSSITGDGTYTIGGFVTRRITFPPFNRIQNIGTIVTDINKLQCVDVGGYTFNYQNNKNNNSLTFTITDSSGNLDNTGSYIYICDDN
jgi:hypothetical protein